MSNEQQIDFESHMNKLNWVIRLGIALICFGFGIGGWACEVTGGSDVRFIGCELLGYGGQGPNRGGLSVGTGCVAKLTACVLDGFNGGEALSNAGLVLDGLNNTFSSRSGNAPLTILNVATLPSADPGVSGAVWNNNGVLNISP